LFWWLHRSNQKYATARLQTVVTLQPLRYNPQRGTPRTDMQESATLVSPCNQGMPASTRCCPVHIVTDLSGSSIPMCLFLTDSFTSCEPHIPPHFNALFHLLYKHTQVQSAFNRSFCSCSLEVKLHPLHSTEDICYTSPQTREEK
jgi:hypothetical protein